ncbi:chromosomal replication initiator DnaA [Rhodobacterales bacterium 52_120_T64]|nr:chromosomal replication initiator DnaA [Rhodobacterales bacterium 52_120_T64]
MSKPEQLVLDLPSRAALGREDFFVSPANALALQALDRWPGWATGKLALCGPAASGKSHLVQVWAARSGGAVVGAEELAQLDVATLAEVGGVAVEDVHRLSKLTGAQRDQSEVALFHLHNRLLGAGGTLLVTGEGAPSRWKIALPDLASRLRATEVATLEAPDDALLSAILVKLFADRQLQVSPDLIQFLLSRIDRSFASAKATVEALDRAGLSRKRAITPRLAGEVLRTLDTA